MKIPPTLPLCALLALTPLLAETPSKSDQFELPALSAATTPKVLLLAIDEQAFPMRANLALFLTKPTIRREPVLAPLETPDAPDNVAVQFNGTVLHENGRFRMWYYAVHAIPPEGGFDISPVCYAESADGIHWTRPDLGQVEWHGNRHNNCIALGADPTQGSNSTSVIRDDDDPRPERRYKMAYGYQDQKIHTSRGATAVSPDGIHWTRLPNDVSGEKFMELASLYKQGGLYIVGAHVKGWGEGDRPEGRQGYAWVSPDFEHWLPEPAPSFKVAEPVVGSGVGTHGQSGGHYTQDHIGVGAISFGNVVVGMWGMWHNHAPNWGEGGIDCDLGLLVSHDGLHFDEVVKGLPYIRSEESPADPVPGRHYPTILHQNNSILEIGDETWIYHGRWRNAAFQNLALDGMRFRSIAKDYWACVALARIPRDRFGALVLTAKENSGSVWTTPVTLPAGSHLTLNATGLAGLRVEVADARFQSLPGFEQGSASGKSDDFKAEVRWTDRALADLAGKTVRFRITMTRAGAVSPRLYALNLDRTP